MCVALQVDVVEAYSALTTTAQRLAQATAEHETLAADLASQRRELTRTDREIDEKYAQLYRMDSDTERKETELKE